MQVDQAIRAMLDARGASARAVSLGMGRSRGYVLRMGAPGHSPALATVADIADALGYDVALVDRETGDTLGTVDPPRRAASEQEQG